MTVWFGIYAKRTSSKRTDSSLVNLVGSNQYMLSVLAAEGILLLISNKFDKTTAQYPLSTGPSRISLLGD